MLAKTGENKGMIKFKQFRSYAENIFFHDFSISKNLIVPFKMQIFPEYNFASFT